MPVVITLTILGLLIALIGIEMVNTPPTKRWHKWFYRISFFVIGLGVVVMTCLQYRGEEEKSKTTYDSFANVISNEMEIKNSVDEGNTNVAKAIGIPEFRLFLNNNLITNGSVFSLNKTRVIQLIVENTSEVTADAVAVDFEVPIGLSQTNVIANGWHLEPQSTTMDGTRITGIPTANHWRWIATESIPNGHIHSVDYLEITTNFSFPVIPVIFDVFSNRSKNQKFMVTLTF